MTCAFAPTAPRQPHRRGVVVLVDIDTLKRQAEALALARDYADAIVQTLREALVVLGCQPAGGDGQQSVLPAVSGQPRRNRTVLYF